MRSLVPIPQIIASATPATPASGFSAIYQKSDGDWYCIDDAGHESFLFMGAGPQVFSAVGDFTSASTSPWVVVLDDTTDVLAAGDYLIDVSYYWSGDGTADSLRSQGKFDNVAFSAPHGDTIHRQEAKEVDGTHTATGTTQSYPFATTLPVTLATSKAVDVYWEIVSGATHKVSIWSFVYRVRRVG